MKTRKKWKSGKVLETPDFSYEEDIQEIDLKVSLDRLEDLYNVLSNESISLDKKDFINILLDLEKSQKPMMKINRSDESKLIFLVKSTKKYFIITPINHSLRISKESIKREMVNQL